MGRLTETVRRGTVTSDSNAVAGHEQDHRVKFARAMTPMAMPVAMAIADIIQIAGAVRCASSKSRPAAMAFTVSRWRSGTPKHVSRRSTGPECWRWRPRTLGNGVADRHTLLPGDAFKADYGTGYDIVLITNFLHHFDIPTNTTFLKKVAAALLPGEEDGDRRVRPNEDRVSPPIRPRSAC